MFVFRHLAEVLINPFFLVLLGFALCLAWLWSKGDSITLRLSFLMMLSLFLLFSSGWPVAQLTRHLEDKYPPVTQVNPAIQWVVVLSGGQSMVSNVPSNSLLYSASIKRLVEGTRLYRQLPHARLLLSGGGSAFETPEAAHLSEVASWFAIDKKDIVLETKSLNTIGEVLAIKAILQDAPFYLVTSAIHMPRAMKLCEAKGLHPIAAPTDFTFYWNDERFAKRYIPNAHNLFYLTIAMHEYLGRLWAKIQGEY
ncbi:MAG: ElyC/SanA/YdcF family protein [Tatlockia sp.]|jgi:uncharacterized SAM-binding protein YcdF (DUF218 family)